MLPRKIANTGPNAVHLKPQVQHGHGATNDGWKLTKPGCIEVCAPDRHQKRQKSTVWPDLLGYHRMNYGLVNHCRYGFVSPPILL
jgi:hypothetical protein